MIPVVALIGRPNVGKSTLFNGLTRSRDALVADQPGLTRDRQYGLGNFEENSFFVIDTGGIGVDDHNVDELMSAQSFKALEEADIIYFVVDAKVGVTPIDQEIADKLRRSKLPVVLVINKIDGLDPDVAIADFYQLGFEKIEMIAASHRRGIRQLIRSSLAEFDTTEQVQDELKKIQGIGISIIGRPNVGKSTLVNRILGEERVVAYDLPGTTRDSIFIPFEKDDQQYTLVDTAGLRRRSKIKETVEKFSAIKSIQAVQHSHVCILVYDAHEGVFEQDLHLIKLITDAGKGLMIVINKWDGLTQEQKENIKKELSRRLEFAPYIPIHTISAKHGTGVGKLLPFIHKIYDSCMKELKTSTLTRILEEAITRHPPPLVRGRRIKLRYAHAGGHNPPLIVIHGNQTTSIPAQYKRYLINIFREALKLVGTPIRLEFKSSENPYKGKKNELTASQKRKRNRMIKKFKKR